MCPILRRAPSLKATLDQQDVEMRALRQVYDLMHDAHALNSGSRDHARGYERHPGSDLVRPGR